MRMEILYFEGCPSYEGAEETLKEVLSELGAEAAEVAMVAVATDEEARRLRFPGSPTMRADGEDLFPVPERGDWRLGCRVYATSEGLRGSPTAKIGQGSVDAESGGRGRPRFIEPGRAGFRASRFPRTPTLGRRVNRGLIGGVDNARLEAYTAANDIERRNAESPGGAGERGTRYRPTTWASG